MAHLIDQTTGRDAIAYCGEKPWHGLGHELTPGADIETWKKESGLGYEVICADVQYDRVQIGGDEEVEAERMIMPGRRVLYRSDTGAALSVVSKGYKIVQPGEVLSFFGKLADIGGFELETAGALSDGKRIWALAKVNDGAPVVGQDVVRPYVLLATSFDGSMSTTAKFTAVRVVCNNTITMAVGGAEGLGKVESDVSGAAVSSIVRIPHCNTFNPDEVRLSLGIVGNSWEKWLVNTRIMAERTMSESQADNFAVRLLDSIQSDADVMESNVRKSRGYKSIMSLFDGGSIGSDMAGNSRWAMLNAVTQDVDHNRGRTDSTRMNSAWFGAGEGLKNKAYAMLSSDDEFKLKVAA